MASTQASKSVKRKVPASIISEAVVEDSTVWPAPPARSPGRSRSDASRIAILNAALKLLETTPLQILTIEAIAREAGVGKATIYRWWSSKASIVIDAFVLNHTAHVPMPEGMGARETLYRHVHLLIEQYGGWHGRLVAQILAEGQSNPAVLREFRERFVYGRRAMVQEMIEAGRRSGEFRTDVNADIQSEILYAPIYFRLLVQNLPLDKQFADMLSNTVLQLISVDQAKSSEARLPKARAKK